LTALRRQVGDIAQIYNDYKDHADFLTIYVREAHPLDEWQIEVQRKKTKITSATLSRKLSNSASPSQTISPSVSNSPCPLALTI